MSLRLPLLAALIAVAACAGPSSYECTTGADCLQLGATGVCATTPDGTSRCAFASDECGGGPAFGESAGPYAGTCVGGTDGRELDAPDGPPTCDGGECAHPVAACYVGAALPRAPGCTAQVCSRLASCCEVSWTQACVQLAEIECDVACSSRVVWAGWETVDRNNVMVEVGAVESVDFGAIVGAEPTATVLTPALRVDGQRFESLAWVDFERDQDPELAVVTANVDALGRHQLLHQTATGLSEDRDLTTHGLTGYVAYGVATGDLDDDGDLDLALTGASPGLVSLNRIEAGPVLTRGPLHTDIQDFYAAWVEVGDHDADGDDDVVVYNYNTNNGAPRGAGTLLLGRPRSAGGGVGGTDHVVALPTMNEPRRARFGDLDGDGDLDLAVASITEVAVYRYHGGIYEAEPRWRLTPPVGQPATDYSDAAWIDVDGDRDQDLAVTARAASANTRVQVFLNTGDDLTDTAVWTSLDVECAHQIAVGDVDRDGDLDLAIAGRETPSRLFFNDSVPGNVLFRRSIWQGPLHTNGVVMTRVPTPAR